MQILNTILGNFFTAYLDGYEKENNFFLEAQLPGIKKKDIKIEVENGKLLVSAESCKEKEINEGKL